MEEKISLKINDIAKNPEFLYLLGDYEVELNDIEASLLNFDSKLSKHEALMEWHKQGTRTFK